MCSLSNKEKYGIIERYTVNMFTSTLNASHINCKQSIVNKCWIILQSFRHCYCKIIWNFFTIIWFKLMWLPSIVNEDIKICLVFKKNYSRHFSAFEVLGKDSYMPCEALAHNHKSSIQPDRLH